MTASTILVVDDNATNLKLARLLLQAEGYEVRLASDAEEALSAINDVEPDLILMDLQLPGLDGLELTRRLKQDPKRNNIIVLAFTAYAMKGDEEKARAAGCDGYITKPIDTNTLPKTIADHLRRRRRQQ
jgi:two-component system, cell cycle response regulator DivK